MATTIVNLSNNKLYKLFDESSTSTYKEDKEDKKEALRIVVDRLKVAYQNTNTFETEMLKQEKCTKTLWGNQQLLRRGVKFLTSKNTVTKNHKNRKVFF